MIARNAHQIIVIQCIRDMVDAMSTATAPISWYIEGINVVNTDAQHPYVVLCGVSDGRQVLKTAVPFGINVMALDYLAQLIRDRDTVVTLSDNPTQRVFTTCVSLTSSMQVVIVYNDEQLMYKIETPRQHGLLRSCIDFIRAKLRVFGGLLIRGINPMTGDLVFTLDVSPMVLNPFGNMRLNIESQLSDISYTQDRSVACSPAGNDVFLIQTRNPQSTSALAPRQYMLVHRVDLCQLREKQYVLDIAPNPHAYTQFDNWYAGHVADGELDLGTGGKVKVTGTPAKSPLPSGTYACTIDADGNYQPVGIADEAVQELRKPEQLRKPESGSAGLYEQVCGRATKSKSSIADLAASVGMSAEEAVSLAAKFKTAFGYKRKSASPLDAEFKRFKFLDADFKLHEVPNTDVPISWIRVPDGAQVFCESDTQYARAFYRSNAETGKLQINALVGWFDCKDNFISHSTDSIVWVADGVDMSKFVEDGWPPTAQVAGTITLFKFLDPEFKLHEIPYEEAPADWMRVPEGAQVCCKGEGDYVPAFCRIDAETGVLRVYAKHRWYDCDADYKLTDHKDSIVWVAEGTDMTQFIPDSSETTAAQVSKTAYEVEQECKDLKAQYENALAAYYDARATLDAATEQWTNFLTK